MTAALSEAGTLLQAGTLPPNLQLRSHPRHSMWAFEWSADIWNLDDRDIHSQQDWSRRIWTPSTLHNDQIGAERNRKRTQVIYYSAADEVEAHEIDSNLEDVRQRRAGRWNDELGVAESKRGFQVGLTIVMSQRRRGRNSVRRLE